jgi:hypothetical protein
LESKLHRRKVVVVAFLEAQTPSPAAGFSGMRKQLSRLA